MKRVYIISLSSFYKATYAQEKLRENGIRAGLKKLPPGLLKSCGYGLYLNTDSIQTVMGVLKANDIRQKGVFEVVDAGEGKQYKRLR